MISSTTLATPRSKKHPYGSFSAAGEPVCHDHWLTRCYQCSELFPRMEMTRKVVGKHADTNLREHMRPRIEDVHGAFCPACLRGEPAPSEKAPEPRRYGWVALALMLVSCFVLPYLLLATFRGH